MDKVIGTGSVRHGQIHFDLLRVIHTEIHEGRIQILRIEDGLTTIIREFESHFSEDILRADENPVVLPCIEGHHELMQQRCVR